MSTANAGVLVKNALSAEHGSRRLPADFCPWLHHQTRLELTPDTRGAARAIA
ncbi:MULTISPECIES: hypothetical protein [Paraburkholderia]|uniref:hypothetical protein n=1 Tax=Paraburkholderia TaxID=1822464 RepID=UPI0038BC92A0